MLDLIIPVLNEEEVLSEKSKYYHSLKKQARIIFVDGGSRDRTVQLAAQYGEVIQSSAGRAIQKNTGAEYSKSKYFLFLHVDTYITEDAIQQVQQAMEKGASGGCLTMRIDDSGWIFRIYEWAVNFRARRFGIIDGDLGTFVPRDVFEQLGGFDRLPVMEDLMFGKKLKQFGPIDVLKEEILVSSRKWHDRGFLATFWDYTLAYIRLWSGGFRTKVTQFNITNAESVR